MGSISSTLSVTAGSTGLATIERALGLNYTNRRFILVSLLPINFGPFDNGLWVVSVRLEATIMAWTELLHYPILKTAYSQLVFPVVSISLCIVYIVISVFSCSCS